MHLETIILLATCSLVLGSEEIPEFPDMPSADRHVYEGFPVGIVCADAAGASPWPDYPPGRTDQFIEPENHPHDDIDSDRNEDIESPNDDGHEQEEATFMEFTEIEERDETFPTHPEEESDITFPTHPEDTDMVNCIIKRDGEIIFNQNIEWKDRLTNGVFAIGNDSWDDTKIAVSADWGNDGQLSHGFSIKVNDFASFECSNPSAEAYAELIDIGESLTLTCHGKHPIYMSEEQYNSHNVVWYQGCEKIRRDDPNFEYQVVDYDVDEEDGIQFESLKILNASLRSTAGTYYCVLEQRTAARRRRAFRVDQLVLKEYKVCLQQSYEYANQPTIIPSQTEYVAKPGSNLTVTCHGNTGTKKNQLSQMVAWNKIEAVVGKDTAMIKCLTMLATPEDKNCSASLHQNRNYCEPLLDESIAEVESHTLGDNFTATFTMGSVSSADEGTYQCNLHTTRGTVSGSFTVKVRTPKTTHNDLMIALTVVAVFVAIAVIVLLLLHIYRTDIHYFFKKIFGKDLETTRPVAYLSYTADAHMKMGPNPVSGVLNFLGDNRYFDRNNGNGCVEDSAVGNLIGDHAIDMLKQCLSMIVFLTPELIERNEIEIFDVYRGLEDNVRNNLSIVFICQSKDVRMKIDERAYDSHRTCVTLREFMKKNTVIDWDKRHPNRFHRALYVALPKVRSSSRPTKDQDTFV